jgi:signal transduction histidine kinase
MGPLALSNAHEQRPSPRWTEARRQLPSEHLQVLEQLEERRRFERLLARLSTVFIHLPPREVDQQIERGLKEIVEFLRIERGTLCQFSEDGREMVMTHSYTTPEYPPVPRVNIASLWPWYAAQVRKGQVMRLRRLPDDLPPEAEMERVYYTQTPAPRSYLFVPFTVGNTFLGGMGFGSFRREIDWPEETVQSLQLVSDIFANALVRHRAELKESQLRDTLTSAARVSLMGELAASITHEVNQPLCAIVSNAQTMQRLLAKTASDLETLREIVTDIIHDGERASAIIARTRRMFRHAREEFVPLDVNVIIREMEALTRNEMAHRNVRVRLVLSPGLPAVRGDRVQLQQVLLNLMTNGADAMGAIPSERRELQVASYRDEGRVILSVRDAGVGIASGEEEKLFETFFTTKSGGMGMGLAVSKSIVESHDGLIWAENNSGPGATFKVALPQREIPCT